MLLTGFVPRSASSDDNSDIQAKPSMGQLALYLLALRSNCEFVGGRKGDRLVSQLKRFLEDEKRAIGKRRLSARSGDGSSELWVFSPGLFPALHSAYLTIHLEARACPSSHP